MPGTDQGGFAPIIGPYNEETAKAYEELWEEGLEEGPSPQEEQEKAEANQPRPFASSMVAEAGFDPDAGTLTVVFQNGREEDYNATEEQWEELKAAPSPGRWMHENLL